MGETTQFIIVTIILVAVVIWVIYRLFSNRGRKAGSQSSCCGCALSDACAKKKDSGDESGCNERSCD